MATYTKVPLTVPSKERSARITAVAALDQIDLTEILGRPARGVTLVTALGTDTITYRLNNLLKVPEHQDWNADQTVEIWSGSSRYNTFAATGATEHTTVEGLNVASIEIVSSTQANIEIVIW